MTAPRIPASVSARRRAHRRATAVLCDVLVDELGDVVLVDEELVRRILDRLAIAGVEIDRLVDALATGIPRQLVEDGGEWTIVDDPDGSVRLTLREP